MLFDNATCVRFDADRVFFCYLYVCVYVRYEHPHSMSAPDPVPIVIVVGAVVHTAHIVLHIVVTANHVDFPVSFARRRCGGDDDVFPTMCVCDAFAMQPHSLFTVHDLTRERAQRHAAKRTNVPAAATAR